jgi:hypothetical protein
VLTARARHDEALTAYRDSLAIAEALAGKDPTNASAETDLAATLLDAARAGVEPNKHLMEALAILQPLGAAGALPVDKKRLIDQVKAEMQKSP